MHNWCSRFDGIGSLSCRCETTKGFPHIPEANFNPKSQSRGKGFRKVITAQRDSEKPIRADGDMAEIQYWFELICDEISTAFKREHRQSAIDVVRFIKAEGEEITFVCLLNCLEGIEHKRSGDSAANDKRLWWQTFNFYHFSIILIQFHTSSRSSSERENRKVARESEEFSTEHVVNLA